MKKFNICFIGAGNVATHLAVELQKCGHNITQIYSRTTESAKQLADRLNTDYSTSNETVTKGADIYIVALKDAVVEQVLSQLEFDDKLLVHCSGSLPMNILSKFSKNYGVFYPMQTFSKSREVNFKVIPIFVEANSNQNLQILEDMANEVSESVTVLDSDKRKSLHIAAVFACNFSNHCYALAARYLDSKELPFEILRPLIMETASKVQELHPKEAQTGPAIRFDENIINAHLNELKEMPGLQELYNSISKSIFEHHQEKE
ncbi:F420-dependent NADP oxidoreductase [Draconibacterium sp. IB214405]|uniref:Rossmann-like and DUF2520 domain-containing protein n=1 Tax=Draconibacterium sp. IB214405 TaxID=3097352 RepID=UPI002A105A92|nr:F420-dependent NADP oxidoreductase [Draconibacterium sp. IB214405]MDX8338836.1 F420-dependent NADP oxidoreductase [Draconibacterium sp. IB214405]